MTSRRSFLVSGAITAACALSTLSKTGSANGETLGRAPKVVRRSITRIKSVVRNDETIIRHGGQCDIFPMTWASDDRQFGSFSDGTGWGSSEENGYNTQAIWIKDGPVNASFDEIVSYPAHRWPEDPTDFPLYYGFSTLAVEDCLYHLLCCTEKTVGQVWNGAKLIYSPNQGRTWHNQDGSTPVVWEPHSQRSRETLLFFEEPQRAFSLVSLLQMGKAYEANRDGYVYGYGTNGNSDGTSNQLVMFRVPKLRVTDRSAYEFFGGLTSKDDATWSKDIGARVPVHIFPRGWANAPGQGVVQAWIPSVVYLPAIGLYLMANAGIGWVSSGSWSKPSYLGLWSAPKPWGPWSQIHEEAAWTPGNDPAARCYSPQISPKWIAPDGKSFWLVWSDFQGMPELFKEQKRREAEFKAMSASDRARARLQMARQYAPYYSFNTQRFDLTLT